MEYKNVLLVDDHAITRLGLKELLLEFYPGLKIYESQDGESMLVTLKLHKIDTIVLDIQMSNSDTLSLVELVSIKYPDISVLIFSMLPERVYGRRMLKAGAKGFLSKSAPVSEIRWAFDMVLNSKRYMSSAMADMLTGAPNPDKDFSEPFTALSHREFEIMQDLVNGHSLSYIANRLNLKPSTVGTYKSRIYEKLKVQNIFQLKDMAVLHSVT